MVLPSELDQNTSNHYGLFDGHFSFTAYRIADHDIHHRLAHLPGDPLCRASFASLNGVNRPLRGLHAGLSDPHTWPWARIHPSGYLVFERFRSDPRGGNSRRRPAVRSLVRPAAHSRRAASSFPSSFPGSVSLISRQLCGWTKHANRRDIARAFAHRMLTI